MYARPVLRLSWTTGQTRDVHAHAHAHNIYIYKYVYNTQHPYTLTRIHTHMSIPRPITHPALSRDGPSTQSGHAALASWRAASPHRSSESRVMVRNVRVMVRVRVRVRGLQRVIRKRKRDFIFLHSLTHTANYTPERKENDTIHKAYIYKHSARKNEGQRERERERESRLHPPTHRPTHPPPRAQSAARHASTPRSCLPRSDDRRRSSRGHHTTSSDMQKCFAFSFLCCTPFSPHSSSIHTQYPHPSSHCHVVTHCSASSSLSCAVHPSLLPPHPFIPPHPPTHLPPLPQ
jgi:hypothetical protein